MARPSKYNEEMQSTSEAYLDDYSKEYGHLIPSVVGLAEILNVTAKTLYNWSDLNLHPENTEFLHILERINQRQHRILLQEGLKGEFNAAITKLALGKHGYHDKVDTDVTTGGKELSNNFIINPVTTNKDD